MYGYACIPTVALQCPYGCPETSATGESMLTWAEFISTAHLMNIHPFLAKSKAELY